MLDRLSSVNCPTLFHFGSRDPYIAGEGIEAVGSAIAGHPRFLLNVEIAGHAFDNQAPMFHDEAAARSAWAKTMAFLADHLPVSSSTRSTQSLGAPIPRRARPPRSQSTTVASGSVVAR